MGINLKETSWARTCKESKKWLLSHVLSWILAFIFPGVGTVIASCFIPDNPSIELSAFYGFLGGCVGFIFLLFIVYGFNLFVSPYKQRNEARKALESIPGATSNSPRVAEAELHFQEVNYQIKTNNPLTIEIGFIVNATGNMLLESVVLDIAGNKEPCNNWESYEINSSFPFGFTIACEISHVLASGEHNAKLLIFANSYWWASEQKTIIYNSSPSS